VLGHCQCRHLEPRGLVEQLVYPAGAIEQGKLGVTMKVNEVWLSHWILYVNRSPFTVPEAVRGQRITVNGKR
jgi:hypothetical protein